MEKTAGRTDAWGARGLEGEMISTLSWWENAQ